MIAKLKFTELFPIPIGRIDIPQPLTQAEMDILVNQELTPNTGNSNSKNSYILDLPGLESLKQFMEDSVKTYLDEVYSPTKNVVPYITQSWVNYTITGQYHHKHHHPNSIVSGVFYINTNNQSDRITFFRPGIKTTALPVETYHRYNSLTWWIEAEQGSLLLFPSELEHMVQTTTSLNTRISLSFNTFVKGSLGNLADLDYVLV